MSNTASHPLWRLASLAFALLLAACGDTTFETPGGPVPGATRIVPADGPISAVTDTVLAALAPQRVLLLDHIGRPVPGVAVMWTASSNGHLSAHSSTTDSSGIAQVRHTLGPKVGHFVVRAHVIGLAESPVTFPVNALPGKPVDFSAVAGTGQAGLVRTAVAPYAVSVTDAYGNEYAGLTVSWSVLAGDGSIDRATSFTTLEQAGGEPRQAAVVIHTLGPDEEPQVVAATLRDLPGFAPVTFSTVPVSAVVRMAGEDDDYYCFYWGWCTTWSFSPLHSEVPVGRNVLWVWEGRDTHDIVFEDEPTPPTSAGPKTAGMHVREFTRVGTVRYRCTLHSTSFTEGMVGSVTVK